MAVIAFLLGRIVFGILSVMTIWRWGVLATVLAAEVTVAWLIRCQRQQVVQVWTRAYQAIASWANKITLPVAVTDMWVKVRGRVPSAPSGGWLLNMAPNLAIGVAGTAVLLAPLATYVLVSFLLWLVLLAVMALVVVTVVRYMRTN